MDELVAWLRWQIDRDEEFARIAPKMAAKRREQLLAEVQAKRAILDEHRTQEVASLDRDTWAQTFIVCRVCRVGERQVVAPCPTLRLLASMYAHCEGYRDEWRPS